MQNASLRHRPLGWAFSLLSLALISQGCSSSETSTPADTPDAGSDTDGGDPNASGGDAGVDAAPAKRMGRTGEASYEEQSCDEVCQGIGGACGPTDCKSSPGKIGEASYATGTKADVTSCSSKPDATSGGEKFERVICCCEVPWIIKPSTPPTLRSCTDICAADGLKCREDHDWGSDGKGGLHASYVRPSTQGIRYRVMGCEAPPPATINLPSIAEDGELVDYDCACEDK